MRLIDADALKEKLLTERDAIPKTVTERYGFGVATPNHSGNLIRGGIRKALRCMEQTPTIDPASLRPKGEWILEAHNDQVNYGWNVTAKCPNCGKETKRIGVGFFLGFTDEQVIEIALQRAAVKLDNFCPNCGADIRHVGAARPTKEE